MNKRTWKAVALTAVCLMSSAFAQEQDWNDAGFKALHKRMMRDPHPHLGAAHWDILDYPQPTAGNLVLQNIHQPDQTVDVSALAAGKVMVLVDVNPAYSGNTAWGADLTPIETYHRLRKEFADKGIEFVAIWTDIGKAGKKGPQGTPLERATAYAKKHELPGLLLLDEKPEGKSKRNAYWSWVQLGVPGHTHGHCVAILNKESHIVYRGVEQIGIAYHTTRHILNRLLDADYDIAVRREFYPEKSRELPTVEKHPDGLVYRDDFEGYADDHDFKLQPRWGFSYDRQSRLDQRPIITAGEGRDASKALLVEDAARGSYLTTYGLQHRLPVPLTDGVLRFFIRRYPADMKEREPSSKEDAFRQFLRALCVRFEGPDSYEPAGFLFASGKWGEETFVSTFRKDMKGPVAYSRDKWHEVTVVCKPGIKAVLAVDGAKIADLESEAISWIGFRQAEGNKNFYVDDVEVFYHGDADKLLAAHQAARPESIEPVTPLTTEELAAIEKKHELVTRGDKQAVLPPGSIPRADVPIKKGQAFTFDHPLDLGPLVMEDLRNPGTLLDITEKYKGEIIYVTWDNSLSEGYMRGRTINRSPTVFHRNHLVAKEYKDKGVVIVAIGSSDGGHRGASNSIDDRTRTVTEAPWITQAIKKELGGIPDEHVIYGSFFRVWDEMLVERIVGESMIWKRLKMGRILDGQFGSCGSDVILNKEGKCVFRGTGPDGHGYWKQRAVFDRLLDDDFDAAYRQEFRNPELPHFKDPRLPKTELRVDGLAYTDDFESYKDTYDFGLQPRWGFSYANFPDENTPTLFDQGGREDSRALLINAMWLADQWCGNAAKSVCTHEFPLPLTDGHFRCFIRRGPHVKVFGKPPLFRIQATCVATNGDLLTDPLKPRMNKKPNVIKQIGTGSDGKMPVTLTTFGAWKKETFGLAPTLESLNWACYGKEQTLVNKDNFLDSGIAMDENTWQEIKLVCKPGQMAEWFIDNVSAGKLNIEAVKAVQLRGEVWSGTWIDDAELFYAGDATALQAEHAKAMKTNLLTRQAAWAAEVEASQ